MAAISTGPRITERQPALNTPDPSYHGAVWTEAVKPLGPIAYIIKARVTLLRDLGSALSPFNAFLALQGLESLALRIAKHSENAQKVVEFLRMRPEIVRVIYPSVQTGMHRERARRYLKGGLRRSGWLRVRQWRSRAQLYRCAGAILPCRQYRRLAQSGDPSGHHHAFAAFAEEQGATGVSDGYVRLSVGIEHIDDIIADIERGLNAAGKLAKAA